MDTEALLSGQISFTGLGSGTDFKTMIDQLLKLEQRHTARLEIWKAEWEVKQAGFRELNSKMLSLRTNLQGMNTMSRFMVKGADSINTNVLTATATDKAQVGTHSITVNQLAQNHILTTDAPGQTSSTTDITSGSISEFSYTYKGKTRVLIIPSGTTLEGFRNLINTDPENPGVRAGIIKNAEGDYRLQLRGMDLGTGKNVVIEASTLDGFSANDFVTTLKAQDSQIKLDGFPAEDSWIERSTNSISDLIEGVTLNLREQGTTTLNIAVDNEQVKDNVRQFVNQVNEVRQQINELSKVDTSGNGSILTGNYAIQMIDSRLKSILAVKSIGFDVNNDVFSSLSMVGITTDADQGSPTFGMLKLDEEVLDHSLRNRPDALAQVFAADHIGSSDSQHFRYLSSVDGVTKGGEYSVQYTVSGGTIINATINGNPASYSGNGEITGQSGKPEAGMVIKVDDLATEGTFTGKVFLKYGKIPELADALRDLTDISSGPLKILEENYDDITKGIDRKIEFEQRRITRLERDLRNRFARLETLLGYYDQLGQAMNSQMGMLRSDNK
ncbi:flagellar hook-associated protein 2 [Desulfonatronum thiosulfatophilum]|uniref:Flagellar hook-associated protein 2 n=1 Tax=Desulfonatronum thiosulfatophilum TaxID=617002 RepID=A0A1G6A7E6_9BACT|nr:flagellar filament capping protein FliD [Desulfonatronum thiosulfatophilum]SDB04226.1 flagellar hook-associated protein 2 [Desulfonatronum thiosulfatophilum]